MSYLSRKLVNYVNSTVNLPWSTRNNAISYVNNQEKYVRNVSHMKFLQVCLHCKVLPKYVRQKFEIDGYEDSKVIQRKTFSLGIEMLREDIRALDRKHRQLIQEGSYLRRNLQRTTTENKFVEYVLNNGKLVSKAIVKSVYERHCKKWLNLCHRNYPIPFASYKCYSQPRFPFKINITQHNTNRQSFNNKQKFTSEAGLEIPDVVSNFLNKGPKYRLPPVVNKAYWNRVSLNFDNLVYSLRWKKKFDNSAKVVKDSSIIVPFDKNSCYFPPKMSEDLESKVHCFGNDVKDILVSETNKLKRSEYYRNINKQSTKSKQFLNSNELDCIRSDKTNRLVICKSTAYIEKNEEVLKDSNTYLLLSKTKNDAIEKQANILIKTCVKNSRFESHMERLMSTGSKPATFFSFVKDHKIDVNDYPVRPIASVRNTPIEKIDWIICSVLSNVLPHIESHLPNAESLIDLLNNLDFPESIILSSFPQMLLNFIQAF